MNSLDRQFEELIVKLNKTLKENTELKALVKSLKRTIEGLKNDRVRDSGVSKKDSSLE